MSDPFRKDLEPVVEISEAAILEVVRERLPNARLERIGPLDFGTPNWSCWIVTTTDEERDTLIRDAAYMAGLKAAAEKAGFAPDSFTVQSQETVDRDYGGSWFYAMR